jgi:hypothetical protein
MHGVTAASRAYREALALPVVKQALTHPDFHRMFRMLAGMVVRISCTHAMPYMHEPN